MSVKHNLEQWIAQLDYDDTCDISDRQVSELIRNYAALEAKCAALAAENAGMDAFIDALLSIAWQGGSADGAEIQDLALKHGLLRQKVYSADEHETLVDDPGNFEDGDPVYFRIETPATDAFLAEVRAQGVDMAACALDDVNQFNYANMLDDLAQKLRQEASK